MKRAIAIALIFTLLVMLAGCGTPSTPDDATSGPDITTDGAVSPSGSPGITGATGTSGISGSPGLSATPSGSAAPGQTTPGGSGVPGASASPGGSVAPSATPTPKPASAANWDVEYALSFSKLCDNVNTIVMAKVTKDTGVQNVWALTSFGKNIKHVLYNHWTYELEVTKVYKSSGGVKLKVGDTFTYSIPYEFNMDTRTNTTQKDASFIAIEAGKTYLLFMDYDVDTKLFSCENKAEPNKFLLENDLLFIKTAEKSVEEAFAAGQGKTGIQLSKVEPELK